MTRCLPVTSSWTKPTWVVAARMASVAVAPIVMGLAPCDGNMKAVVIPDVKKDTLRVVVLDNVEPGSTISTDELVSYNLLAVMASNMAS